MRLSWVFHLLFLTILISCNSDEESNSPVLINTDYSGEYEGRVLMEESIPKYGLVIYKLESNGPDSYTGFYEGVEFAQISIDSNKLSGIPSGPVPADSAFLFDSLNGEMLKDFFDNSILSFECTDANGETKFWFQGGKMEQGQNRIPAIIKINGKDQHMPSGGCPGIGNNSSSSWDASYGFFAHADVGYAISLNMKFENAPDPGTYLVKSDEPAIGNVVNVDLVYGIEEIKGISGSIEVSTNNTMFFFPLDSIHFDTATQTIINLEGTVDCFK